MKYFKIMMDGATLCCIETKDEISFDNVYGVLNKLNLVAEYPIEKIIEVDKQEAYEWYEVINYKVA